jgi:hypothetical protein
MIAKIWRERTGEGQDIHVDVRKALRRFSPFLDGKWELVNGFPGRTDPYSPFMIVRARDVQGKPICESRPRSKGGTGPLAAP